VFIGIFALERMNGYQAPEVKNWHPSGKLIVIQAQKAHVPKYADNKCAPGAGALNDLWIITI
jgi:hypothetical protein